MKKILFVITKSNWGGAQRYVFDLATHLPREEFETVVAFGGAGPLKEKLEAAGVRTISIPSFQRDISIGKEFASLKELTKIFKDERPDIVHLNSSKAVFLGALVGRFVGVPNIIATVHGWAFNEARPAWQKDILRFVQWLSVILAHKTIVVSYTDAKQAENWPFVGNKITAIHNGIDLQMQLGSGEKIRQAFPAGAHITGTIGELTKNKNQITLVEQAKQNPELCVAIVGEGEERTNLEANIKEYGLGERVKLFGFMPASEVLKGFDTFALPSLKEGLPYVLLEARAAGLPIIANRVGGVSEILDAYDMREFSLEKMVEKTKKLY